MNDKYRGYGRDDSERMAELYRHPLGTFEEERQRFTNSQAAEGIRYGSSAEAYQDFKTYYDKRLKVASEAGMTAWSKREDGDGRQTMF